MNFDELWNDYWKMLYSDLNPKVEFPITAPLLSHYTSIINLENILRGEKVWLSNPLFMNDLEEVRFGVNNGYNLVLESEALRASLGDDERVKLFFSHFESCYYIYANEEVLDLYIVCFSVHSAEDTDGRLSMWRGYGQQGKGVAIVFDSSKVTVVDHSPLVLAPVQYATNEERVAFLKEKISSVAEFISSNSVPLEYIHVLAEALFRRVCIFAVFTKHRGFLEENEWRIAYLIDRDNDSLLEPYLDYHNGPEGIQPKLKLPLNGIPGVIEEGFSVSDIIHSIIIGPSASSPLTVASIQRMLSKIDKPELMDRVQMSSIPFRET